MRVLLVDDHPLILSALQAVIQGLGDDVTVFGVASADEARAALKRDAGFDLALLDLGLGEDDGFDLLAELRSQYPALPVVVVSATERQVDVIRAIDMGAMGFVPKSSATRVLINVIKSVMDGNATPATLSATKPASSAMLASGVKESQVSLLTLRQIEVLSRVCQGKANKQIATELGLSEKTVKAHVTAIFKVLGVANRTQAALAARSVGVVFAS